jgi:hypothetical protein
MLKLVAYKVGLETVNPVGNYKGMEAISQQGLVFLRVK